MAEVHADDEFGLPLDFVSSRNKMKEEKVTDSITIGEGESGGFGAAQPVPMDGIFGAEGADVISFDMSIPPKRPQTKSASVWNKYSHPEHYNTGKIEVWDFVADQGLDFFAGNVVKYVSRAGKKVGESRLSDLQKARTYIQKMIDLSA